MAFVDDPQKTISNTLSSLTLEDDKQEKSILNNKVSTVNSIPCLQCNQIFAFPQYKDDYLGHLFLEHRLVIADIDDIGDLNEYLLYWSNEFKKVHELQEFCTTILLDQLPDGKPSKNEKYYLLSDILPKDYDIRKKLHEKRLEKVLTQYQYERCDRTFERECLYCRDYIKGLRSNYIEHLYDKHFLQLGKSENLVYIDELLDCVQNKLENLICIFCEKIFKDRPTLKEHMRKKGHKRINPDIKFYDKFYLENYKIEKPKHVKNMNTIKNKNKMHIQTNNYENNRIEMKSQRKQQSQQYQRYNKYKNTDDDDDDEDFEGKNHNKDEIFPIINSNSDENDSDWSDWDGEQIQLICFFCTHKDTDIKCLKSHLLIEHNFDFDLITKSLTFYQKIKIVNYIRRQIHILHCILCNQNYKTLQELIEHMNEMKHYNIGDKKQWDRPEYFFPTYEDDGILYSLDDIDYCNKENNGDDDNNYCSNNMSDETSVIIISEDIKASINKDAEALSMENFQI